ncbi:hypothetical protein TRIUR3_13503 [Triticum urartu]|uniref:Uncharacterized protein n=1 Tax=Triticum urartu TaxID=4572 RepID=M7ZDI5_TRIUA|nr:hypothetical protein TRIUR3_13503 [Triticum urartu]
MVRLLPTHRYAYSCQHHPLVVVRGADDAMKESEEEEPHSGVKPPEKKDEGKRRKVRGSNPIPTQRCTTRCRGAPPTWEEEHQATEVQLTIVHVDTLLTDPLAVVEDRTTEIMHAIRSDLSEFKCGLAHLFLHHTSASLTLNENYDPDVQTDTETFLSRIVPEGPSAPWRHTIEGSDDMPAHIKSSMFGCALTIPITDGRLNMGTWQGIWLCEHRDYATPRTIVITLSGI